MRLRFRNRKLPHSEVFTKAVAFTVGLSPGPRTNSKCCGFVKCQVASEFGGFSPNLAPIYFSPVGTVLTFSLKMVPAVDCCTRLCTESNLLLISRFSVRPRGGSPTFRHEYGPWRNPRAIVFPQMVTNCFGLDILRIILLRGILDLLIKSKLFFCAQACTGVFPRHAFEAKCENRAYKLKINCG